jgi:hypothetical protein
MTFTSVETVTKTIGAAIKLGKSKFAIGLTIGKMKTIVAGGAVSVGVGSTIAAVGGVALAAGGGYLLYNWYNS